MMQVMNCAQQFLLRWSDFHNFIMTDIITRSGPGLQYHAFESALQQTIRPISLQRHSVRCECSWRST
jgi:hypothetical protein